MHRLISALFLAVMAIATAIGRPLWAQPALVFDMDTGRVLLAEEPGRRWYPASLTKLMTAYLVFNAIEKGRLRLDTQVTISRKAANGGGRGAARYGAKPGEKMTVHAMLAFLLVRSDADMAVGLAEAVAGSEEAFVARMNETARRLGMSATRFANAHGMHNPQQYTTARDMGLLAMAIYHHFLKKHPDWWRYFSAPYVTKKGHKQRNRNKLLFMMPEANGMKTGFLCTSGFNLLATARRNGRQIAAVVFGRKTGYTRALVAKVLLKEGFLRLADSRWQKGPFIAALRNETGSEPVNLRKSICARRQIRYALPRNASGWAVAFGQFKNAVNAEEIIDAERMANGLAWRDLGEFYGVARLSPPPHFTGLVWRLNESVALSLCARARLHEVDCTVYPPESFRQMATAIISDSERRLRRQAARARKVRKINVKSRKLRKRQHLRKKQPRPKVTPAHGG